MMPVKIYTKDNALFHFVCYGVEPYHWEKVGEKKLRLQKGRGKKRGDGEGGMSLQYTYATSLAWRLPQRLFEHLQTRWGPHDVDRFASKHTHLLPRWNSLDDDGAETVDAFSTSWANANNYINAPWDLLPRVLAKLHNEKAHATIVAPHWPSQPWWPVLTALCNDRLRLHLPLDVSETRPTTRGPEPLRNRAWRVFAFRV